MSNYSWAEFGENRVVIYNNARKTLTVWPFQNYTKGYSFDVNGTRLEDE